MENHGQRGRRRWIYREYPANGIEAADRVWNDGTNSYHITAKELKNSKALQDKMIDLYLQALEMVMEQLAAMSNGQSRPRKWVKSFIFVDGAVLQLR